MLPRPAPTTAQESDEEAEEESAENRPQQPLDEIVDFLNGHMADGFFGMKGQERCNFHRVRIDPVKDCAAYPHERQADEAKDQSVQKFFPV